MKHVQGWYIGKGLLQKYGAEVRILYWQTGLLEDFIIAEIEGEEYSLTENEILFSSRKAYISESSDSRLTLNCLHSNIFRIRKVGIYESGIRAGGKFEVEAVILKKIAAKLYLIIDKNGDQYYVMYTRFSNNSNKKVFLGYLGRSYDDKLPEIGEPLTVYTYLSFGESSFFRRQGRLRAYKILKIEHLGSKMYKLVVYMKKDSVYITELYINFPGTKNLSL